MAKLIGSCCLAATLMFSLNTFAQSPQSETYGTQSEIAHVIPATVFSPSDSNVIWHSYGPNSGIKFVGNFNGCCLDGPVFLPSGAAITGIEVDGCDNSATAQLSGFLAICTVSSVPCTASTSVSSGFTPVPGCAAFRANISPPLTVNNAANTYLVEFSNDGDTTGTVWLVAARVYYKLQISPDPSTATFADVPVGHPFHRFVEALAAAGITGGCGNGNYCPDSPITRGQMAVFLSGALGLHWAP